MDDIEIRRHAATDPWTYAMLDRHQRAIAERARAGGPGALLLSEVASVITVARRTRAADLLLSDDELARLGTERIATDRGGLATWHGPGQWVLFAVDSLERLTGDRHGVRKAIDGLLAISSLAAREAGVVDVETRAGAELGVWSRGAKLGAVGIRVERGVALHGLSLNGFRTPQSFAGLRPCGLDAPVGYVNELARAGDPKSTGSASSSDDDACFLALGRALQHHALGQFWRAD